jgi:hypothetical protein
MTLFTGILWFYVLVALGLAVLGLYALRDMERSIEAGDKDSDEALRMKATFERMSEASGITPQGIMVLSALLWPVTLFGKSIK